jgi:hypothetical protein
MNLTSLTSSDLKQMVKLLAQREVLVAKMEKLDQQLAAFDSGKPSVKAGRTNAPRKRRGNLKASVIDLLKKAGKEGATVKAIAGKLNLGANRIYTWFYGTGKNVKEIKKIGEAKYRWEA